jgi:hypothetical protein
MGNSLSENNLLANFKNIAKEINDSNSMSMYMKRSYDAEEIVINNDHGNDDNDDYNNFFVAIAEDQEDKSSGQFQVKEIFSGQNSNMSFIKSKKISENQSESLPAGTM